MEKRTIDSNVALKIYAKVYMNMTILVISSTHVVPGLFFQHFDHRKLERKHEYIYSER